MRRFLSILAGIGCALALAGLPSAPARAGTVTFPVDSWTVTVSIPDFTYTGNDCEKAPWTADIQGPDYAWASISFTAKHQAKPQVRSRAAEVVQDTILVCPALNGSGVFTVAGEATIHDTASHTAPFTTTFVVNPMPTTTVLAGYAPAGQYDWTTFTGRVVAHSTRLGDIGAYPASEVVIEEQVGGGPWTQVARTGHLNSLGDFSATANQAPTPNALYRASYLGSGSSAPSVSNTVQAPPAPSPVVHPTPTVKVKAVSGRSKLHVDVNPDKGNGYWTFRVQRRAANHSWRTLKTYRTKGAHETRTVDLEKGTYRVRVKAKYGYQGVTSGAVRLRR